MGYRNADGSYNNPRQLGKVSFQTWLAPEEKNKIEAVIWHRYSDPSQKKKFLEWVVQQEYLKILAEKGITHAEFYQQYNDYVERQKKYKLQKEKAKQKNYMRNMEGK